MRRESPVFSDPAFNEISCNLIAGITGTDRFTEFSTYCIDELITKSLGNNRSRGNNWIEHISFVSGKKIYFKIHMFKDNGGKSFFIDIGSIGISRLRL